MRRTGKQWLRLVMALTVVFTMVFPTGAASIEVGTSGADQQIAVEVTAYNEDLGLIRDQRRIVLSEGITELRFTDVAAGINPATVHIRSLTAEKGLSVLEQNYEYDLLSPARLLDKYVGKDVKLYSKNPYTEREEIVTARVLSNNDGHPVFQIEDEVTFGHPGRIIFPRVPDNLIARPTLVWLLRNEMPDAQEIEVAYLTGGIGWRADYVLALDAEDRSGSLSGWVTLNNRSGATYTKAKLKLVAGDINRVQPEALRPDMRYRALMAEAAAPPFREEAFFEYHLYTLDRPTTLKDQSIKQINLLSAPAVRLTKEFVLQGEETYFRVAQREAEQKRKVGVFLEFDNSAENGMGLPVPKGIIRVYKHDAEGSLQFTGEDSIDHTPENEKIRIKLGEAFDIAATRKQTAWQKLAADTYEAAFEIRIRNRKQEDIHIRLVEPVPGDWQVIHTTHDIYKTASSRLEMTVPVKKDSETVVAYRVRMRF